MTREQAKRMRELIACPLAKCVPKLKNEKQPRWWR